MNGYGKALLSGIVACGVLRIHGHRGVAQRKDVRAGQGGGAHLVGDAQIAVQIVADRAKGGHIMLVGRKKGVCAPRQRRGRSDHRGFGVGYGNDRKLMGTSV